MSWTGIPGESQMIATPPPMSTVWATWSPSSSLSNFLTRSRRMAVVQGNICDLMSGWDELESVSLRPRRLVWTLLLLAPIWLNLTSRHVNPTPPFPFLSFFLISVKHNSRPWTFAWVVSSPPPPLYPPPHSYYKIFSPLGGVWEGSGSLPRRACSADRTLF